MRGRSKSARKKLAELGEGEIACISAITEAELQHGINKNPSATALRAAVGGFLGRIKVLPWGRPEAKAYGELRAEMEIRGKSLGNMDMLIAAHAFAVGAFLVSNDNAFRHVSGLRGSVVWAEEFQ